MSDIFRTAKWAAFNDNGLITLISLPTSTGFELVEGDESAFFLSDLKAVSDDAGRDDLCELYGARAFEGIDIHPRKAVAPVVKKVTVDAVFSGKRWF